MALKVNNIPDWTQAQLDAQIALGNFPVGTVLNDIVLPSDWNALPNELVPYTGATADVNLGVHTLTASTLRTTNGVILTEGSGQALLQLGGNGGGGFDGSINILNASDAITAYIDAFQGNASFTYLACDLFMSKGEMAGYSGDIFIADNSGLSHVAWRINSGGYLGCQSVSSPIGTIDELTTFYLMNGITPAHEIVIDIPNRILYDSDGLTPRLEWGGLNGVNITGVCTAGYFNSAMTSYLDGIIALSISSDYFYAGNGAVGGPSHSFNNAANWGMWYGSSFVNFSAAGALAFRYSTAGVGIGGTFPILAALHIAKTTEQLRVGYTSAIYWNAIQASTGATTFTVTGGTSNTFNFASNVGIGVTPLAKLHTQGTTEQLRVGYDASNYYKTTVASTGSVTFDVVGTNPTFTFADKIISPASTTSLSSQNIPVGTAPTTPVIGDIWNDASQNMVVFFNGNTLYQAGNLYTATADATINSVTPTTCFSGTKLGTTTIKANTLKVGQKFSIWGAGYYSTPLANTSTVTITVKIGSTTVSTVTTAAFPASATNLPFDFILNFTVRAIGASATLVCDGTFNYATAVSAVAKTSNSLSSIGTVTFDSTADKAMDVLASWSAVTTQTATIQQSKIDFL